MFSRLVCFAVQWCSILLPQPRDGAVHDGDLFRREHRIRGEVVAVNRAANRAPRPRKARISAVKAAAVNTGFGRLFRHSHLEFGP